MFPRAIPVAAFKRYGYGPQMAATGCEQCGADWDKHNVHMLEEKRQVNTDLAYVVAQFCEAVFVVDTSDAKKMGTALDRFLNYSIDQELAQLRANPSQPEQPAFSTVDLMHAAERLAKLEMEKERYQDAIDASPEEVRPMMQAAAGILFSVMDTQIEHAQSELSIIQQALEADAASALAEQENKQ